MDFSTATKAECLNYARIAEAAERYVDMCSAMKRLVECAGGKDLEVEERNLLSVAYKNVVGVKRTSWRTLSSEQFTEMDKTLLQAYKKVVEDELQNLCLEVVDILEKLIKQGDNTDPASMSSGEAETTVFYYKMQGDYYRYLSEFKDTEDYKKKTKESYEKAMETAKKSLPETHPTRLGLALNFSVCFYEILKNPKEACALAKEAFDAAIEKLDTLNDASYKDSTLIMQLLRDNLTLWSSENDGDAAGVTKDPAGANP